MEVFKPLKENIHIYLLGLQFTIRRSITHFKYALFKTVTFCYVTSCSLVDGYQIFWHKPFLLNWRFGKWILSTIRTKLKCITPQKNIICTFDVTSTPNHVSLSLITISSSQDAPLFQECGAADVVRSSDTW